MLDDTKACIVNSSGMMILDRVNIFVLPETLNAWGLNDVNYTSVSVRLAKGADIVKADKAWYTMLRECEGVRCSSKSELIERFERESGSMKSSFLRLEVMLVILIIIGMTLALYSKIKQKRRSIIALRAIGMTKRQIALAAFIQNELFAAAGAAVSLLPIYAFHRLSEYASSLKQTDDGIVTQTAETTRHTTDVFLYKGVFRYDMLNKAYIREWLLVIMLFAALASITACLPIMAGKRRDIASQLKKE